MIILIVHMLYIFFTVKEYTLVLIDEIQSRSLSKHLEAKLEDFYKEKEKQPLSSRKDLNEP